MAICKWFFRAVWVSTSATFLVAVVYLQECQTNEIPTKAREMGLTYPLADPHLEVSFQHGSLELWDGDTMVKRYEAGFGKCATVGRLGADVHSSPIGEYVIVDKGVRRDIASKGSRFLRINFPSEDDAARARQVGLIDERDYRRIVDACRVGLPPPDDTPLGGPLGIQGNFFFFRDRHFTDGNIALSNGDVNEVAECVRVGTPVVIKD